MGATMIKLKRVYEPPAKSDGYRVLVERLWHRAVSKDRAALALWLKDVAPSTELRKWFAHDPAKWPQFQKRYRAELNAKTNDLTLLRRQGKKGTVTLVYAAHDAEHN